MAVAVFCVADVLCVTDAVADAPPLEAVLPPEGLAWTVALVEVEAVCIACDEDAVEPALPPEDEFDDEPAAAVELTADELELGVAAMTGEEEEGVVLTTTDDVCARHHKQANMTKNCNAMIFEAILN